ncbi:MAG TPA: outer membrane lipid asymmetry maintenance protein MlaD [Chiayiivirga sp.]|jgi:phospholipid/cholesterol/gamma-HCH transport system substrate-binding protein|uniref:Outer membrane lipid asymmetry maintenance protein MlaD n=1 Tax=Denitratimonas tolerans TaxID=1338420 RepID=A0AAW9RAX1_9GAMM|nr:outer membrane lipid asymmetry maintenance protein MlaD [Xanthomonadaceae bacterium]MDX9764247.1 outer membrane lipid asymmetry maintenance protein MlaD [Chiayiivirga sp.]MEB2316391.1 outer membrane lipid asymmetry maintenance protein MlaD [Xanthomonadaceae bacterium]HMN34652.1 outer membrane lipid asymmetry maintenance protein MlaD [Chiayiivirga sp.]HRN59336.1 outer membrane lipid asymmetry maintenance protein MlaD [Chiayiivirga sp.]
MASPKTEWSVGAFILMGFACALVLAFASTNSADRMGGASYRVTASFTNAGDLKARAPVKIAGVKVGEIESISLDPNFDAKVTLRLQQSAGELPADTGAAIFTSGLLGERYIGLSPGGDPEPLKDGDEILLTQPAVVLEQLIGKFLFNADSARSDDAGGGAPAR